MLNSAQCESSKDDFHISTWKKIILVWRTGILYQCQTANSIKMLLWMSPQSNGDSLRCQSWFRNCMTKICEHIFFSYIEHVFKIHTNHLVLFFFSIFRGTFLVRRLDMIFFSRRKHTDMICFISLSTAYFHSKLMLLFDVAVSKVRDEHFMHIIHIR